jgi:YVTN family beta-propeller protein
LWINSTSTTIYSTMQDSDELVAIDMATQAIKWRSKTGAMPADVFGTPDDRFLLVGLTGADGVEVFDVTGTAPKLVQTIKTAKGAHSFRAAGDRRHVFLSNRVANSISKIDYQTMTVVDTLPGPSGPDDMDVSSDGRTLFLASRWAGKLTVIDVASRQVLRQIKVGKSPHGVWTLDHAGRQ